MVGNEITLQCCYCGESTKLSNSLEILVATAELKDGSQTLFSHKKCFTETVFKTIPLHPDFFD
jgi:hypothetical protein